LVIGQLLVSFYHHFITSFLAGEKRGLNFSWPLFLPG
jgi:hypothetical protein